DQRPDSQRIERDARIGIRIFHEPGSESVANAVRRRCAEYRTQTRSELQRVRWDRRGADPEEQGLLLRELRVHSGPQVGEQNRFCAAAGDAEGRPVALAHAYLRPAFWKCERDWTNPVSGVTGRSELRAVQHDDEPELPEHHS